MPSGAKDIRLTELKDTVSQLNTTISTQNELIRSLQAKLKEHAEKEAKKDQLIENLQAQLEYLKTKMFGSTSEIRRGLFPGQMSLFDLVPEEEKQAYGIRYPDVEEFGKEVKLGFEKEVLGIYLSGHPLEEYEARWKKNITAVTTDFLVDEETGAAKLTDNQSVTVGGMITGKTVKYTRNNQTMAFLTLEDLFGTVEVIVFPRDYERYHALLNDDEKIFVRGHVSIEEDKDGKLICERIHSFAEAKQELWLQFETKEDFEGRSQELYDRLRDSDGTDPVVIYISSLKAMKRLGANHTIRIDRELINSLASFLGKNNVKVVEKSIEKRS